MSSVNRPKVAFIGTGGTISSLGIHPLELQDYGVHDNRMHASQIIARFPVVTEIAEVIPVDFRNVPSPEIYFAEWRELAGLCHRLVAEHPDLAGIVVGHGTATLEETAWQFEPEWLLGIYTWHSPRRERSTLRFAFTGRVSAHDPARKLDRPVIAAHWLRREQLLEPSRILRTPLVLRCIDDFLTGRRLPLSAIDTTAC